MINLKYGISYLTGVEGASYFEGHDAKVFMVVAYNKETQNVATFLAVALDEESAAQGILAQFGRQLKGHTIVSVRSLYSMLKKLEVALDEQNQ